MLWDHRLIFSPSLTETSLFGAYLYQEINVMVEELCFFRLWHRFFLIQIYKDLLIKIWLHIRDKISFLPWKSRHLPTNFSYLSTKIQTTTSNFHSHCCKNIKSEVLVLPAILRRVDWLSTFRDNLSGSIFKGQAVPGVQRLPIYIT